MDIMTYASVATLPMRITQYNKGALVPEVEFTPFDLYYISRQRYLERSAPTLA
jgi:hypothetical protein